ncbi:TPA: hypothetical protein JBD48_02620 [Legionella pneumophila subsp. pneumophila]|nr:hypothetical protein [Legionella pneumophila subsp. pneumophila]
MNNENKSLFKYIEDIRLSSKNKLTNLGILINSGGIIGILSVTKVKPQGDLKRALLFFIMSICTIFLVELITTKVASDSLTQIIKKDLLNEKVELKDLCFYKPWITNLIWFLNFSAFALGFYAIKFCFDYLK